MATAKANPKRLAVGAMAGALLVASGFFTTLVPGEHGSWLGAFLAQTVAGFALWFGMDQRLKRLYRAGVWTDAELAPTRALLRHRAWMWVTMAIFVAAAVITLFSHRRGGMMSMAVMPLSALGSMRAAFDPPVKKAGGLVDWASMKPLHSEHWGEGRRSES